MKKIRVAILVFFVLVACEKKDTGLVMETASTISIAETDTRDSIRIKAAHVVPTANQYAALKNEFIAFVHFGPNTFTQMEWGTGKEDPKIFNLQQLNTDQWCKAMKEAEMKKVIITAKHHDGFVLWQSRYTKHGIMSSPYKNGKGDILKELAASCKKYGLKLGVYLSPADLYQIENKNGLYGNLSAYTERTIPSPVAGRPFKNKTTFRFKVDDYNAYFLNQLFELLTEYGPIDEVWFDGAHPKRKGGQTYAYLAWKELIQTVAPNAVIFGKQDIRWCGNEAGKTRDTEWNIIPYKEDPRTRTRFPDLTDKDIGSLDNLYQASFLHYQPAETNTSIREGWFYRDDTHQKVRSADDVFDIYERSVGGNSTFLLNIPPNRAGAFSAADVAVLADVGNRIRNTYGTNVLENAKGPKNVLDDNLTTYTLLSAEKKEIHLRLKQATLLNRVVLQEAITTHSERVEQHAVDAWINNAWQEIAQATTIGYKRILRFPEVRTTKLRIRVLASRLSPAIANISAHYYKHRPPSLSFQRTVDGHVTISPMQHAFNWKPHGENSTANLAAGLEIRYTTDGTVPTRSSNLYTSPFFAEAVELKAVAIDKNGQGPVAETRLGLVKKNWRMLAVDSQAGKLIARNAFDEDNETYWSSLPTANRHFIAIDLGTLTQVSGFAYTPQQVMPKGMIERGLVKVSTDGNTWKTVDSFFFGNLINDPTKRLHQFKTPIRTQYIRIEVEKLAGAGRRATIAELDFY